LAGAGTVRIEGYRAIDMSTTRAERRARFGLPPLLPTAVVSRSLRLDPQAPLFTGAPAGARTVVITTAAADPGARRALERVADVAVCGETEVDFATARAALHRRGYTRVLSEGGPTLFARIAAAGVVDELCLSITPLLTGPGAGRIVAGESWPDARSLSLTGLLEEDGALFCRYTVAGPVTPGT
ncbi:MAG: pyrimidine reductase family protein, partial [Jatrophihabitans sp.]